MITGISHAQITVLTDSEANDRKFYCGFFGLKEVEKPENRRRNGVRFWKIRRYLMGLRRLSLGIRFGIWGNGGKNVTRFWAPKQQADCLHLFLRYVLRQRQ